MRPSVRRKWKSSDEPSPREKREMIERGEWEEDEEDEAPNRAPFIFRLLAWSSLVVIFFAIGYGATSLAFKWLDNKAATEGVPRTPPNLVVTPQEAETLLTQAGQGQQARGSTPAAVSGDAAPQAARDGYVTVTISIPDGDVFKTRQIRCADTLREDMIKLALAAYMDAMKEGKMLSAGASELNLFHSGDWLYLNMNGDFLESIKSLGAEKARVMLTGMVKTISDNFAPINKVRFYIDGKEVRDKKPIDLMSPWGINARSS
ncbi:MAG: GerMN domain-containing protein [Synergistaceae bacterium]|jgi:hypothetical protein|nr:GerMN domain-containing protein [Synergistaceae bacterium]